MEIDRSDGVRIERRFVSCEIVSGVFKHSHSRGGGVLVHHVDVSKEHVCFVQSKRAS